MNNEKKHFIYALLVFLLLLIFPFVSSKNIEVNYPSEVEENKEFNIEIKLIDFSEDTYDVKIEVLDENGERASKILQGSSWKSSFYYVNDAMINDKTKTFSLKVENYNGKGEIGIKIRDSAGKSIGFSGYNLTIKKANADSVNEKNNEEEQNEKNKNSNNENTIEDNITDKDNKKEVIVLSSSNLNSSKKLGIKNQTLTVIKLNAKDIKSGGNLENSSIKNNAFYGLIIFCVLITGLLLYKSYKNKRKN